MSNFRKWMSTLAIAVALILVFYYNGVVNSKVTVGVALTLMAGVLLISTFLVPPPGED